MSKHILVIDVGNTNTVCGIYNGMTLLGTLRVSSEKARALDECHAWLKDFVSESKIAFTSVSSVVPDITKTIKQTIEEQLKTPYIFVNGNIELGLLFPQYDPSSIGADLIVNAFAAWQKYQTNCIVCDFGTATTLQLVGSDGTFYGRVIMPGLLTGADSLFEKTALLSIIGNWNLEIENPPLIGTNTRDALSSGIIKGHSYAIDGFVKSIKEQYDFLEPITTVATGGLSSLLAELSCSIDVTDKNLTLDGLSLIASKLCVT